MRVCFYSVIRAVGEIIDSRLYALYTTLYFNATIVKML
jgi:hypothetical protein